MRSLIASCLLVAACSGPDGVSNANETSQPSLRPEHVGTQQSALIGGFPNPSVNASQGLVPNSVTEQETAAVTLDSPPGTTLGHAVAFNSFDTAHLSEDGSMACRGYSASAFSFTLNSSPFLAGAVFHGLRFPAPPNVDALVGDPSVVVKDSGSSWTLYVASLGVSEQAWKAAADPATGCLPYSELGHGGGQDVGLRMDRVCVSVASIPKNGGSPTVLLDKGWCVYEKSTDIENNYDGTALYQGLYTGDIFLAAQNLGKDLKTIAVFRNVTQVVNPFPQQLMTNHPRFPQGPDVVPNLIGRDRNGFWLAVGNSTGDSWTLTKMTSGSISGDATVGGLTLRSIPYAAAIGQNNDGKHLFFFYGTGSPMRLQGVKCGFFPTVTCTELPNSITPAGSNALYPAVAWVNHFPGGDFNTPWLSYWTDATTPAGNLQMLVNKVNITDGSLTPFIVNLVNEKPCPAGDYWGDYDAMTVGDNGGGILQTPFLLRYLTDSTASTCNGLGNPMHVSVTLADPNF